MCKLVGEGRTNKEISNTLNISEKTVEAHRAQGMRKMGATSLAELSRMLLMVKPHTSRSEERRVGKECLRLV